MMRSASYNYSAATSGFVYDTDLKSAWDDGDPEAQQAERELIPAAGEDRLRVTTVRLARLRRRKHYR